MADPVGAVSGIGIMLVVMIIMIMIGGIVSTITSVGITIWPLFFLFVVVSWSGLQGADELTRPKCRKGQSSAGNISWRGLRRRHVAPAPHAISRCR